MACAERIAQTLVSDHLAACVNISSPVTSVYRWQGNLETATEVGLTIKTSLKAYPALATKLKALHPYELPEIVAIHVNEGCRNIYSGLWQKPAIRSETG